MPYLKSLLLRCFFKCSPRGVSGRKKSDSLLHQEAGSLGHLSHKILNQHFLRDHLRSFPFTLVRELLFPICHHIPHRKHEDFALCNFCPVNWGFSKKCPALNVGRDFNICGLVQLQSLKTPPKKRTVSLMNE